MLCCLHWSYELPLYYTPMGWPEFYQTEEIILKGSWYSSISVLVQYCNVSHFFCWIYSDRWLSINSEILRYYEIRSLSITLQNIPQCYTTCLDATLHQWGSKMYHKFCDNCIICLTPSNATHCTVIVIMCLLILDAAKCSTIWACRQFPIPKSLLNVLQHFLQM